MANSNLLGVWYFLPIFTNCSGSWYSIVAVQKWWTLFEGLDSASSSSSRLRFSDTGFHADRKETEFECTGATGVLNPGKGGCRPSSSADEPITPTRSSFLISGCFRSSHAYISKIEKRMYSYTKFQSSFWIKSTFYHKIDKEYSSHRNSISLLLKCALTCWAWVISLKKM